MWRARRREADETACIAPGAGGPHRGRRVRSASRLVASSVRHDGEMIPSLVERASVPRQPIAPHLRFLATARARSAKMVDLGRVSRLCVRQMEPLKSSRELSEFFHNLEGCFCTSARNHGALGTRRRIRSKTKSRLTATTLVRRFHPRGLLVGPFASIDHGSRMDRGGANRQEQWRFRIFLPSSSTSSHVAWSELVPREEETGWLGVNTTKKELKVDLRRQTTT